MRRLRAVSLAVVVFAPSFAAAQAVNGSADWGYGRSTSRSEDQTTKNGSFTQAYTLGYQSVLWDPRFLTYSGELTFHKSALSFDTREGGSRQTGFKTAATLFPARPFPLSVQASRAIGGETANYPTSNPIRGGLALPPDAGAPLDSRQSAFGLSWQLNGTRLPRVELSYHKGSAAMAAGPIEAEQRQSGLHALIARETPRLRNTLRYDRNGFENALSQAFTRRYSELSYELTATASSKASASVRAGRRSTLSLFDLPPQFIGTGTRTYHPPSTAAVGLYYGVATLNYVVGPRVWSDISLSYDRERSDAGGGEALLGTAATRYTIVSGLTVNGNATYGHRGQLMNGSRREVNARGLGAGADYALTFRFLQAGAGYDVGQGYTTSELRDGRTSSWRSRGNLSSGALRLVQLTLGYEQGRSHDDLLELGNQWQERMRATARSTAAGRLVLEASWEQATIDQGRELSVIRNRYLQASGSAAIELSRERRLSVSAGRFLNRSPVGDDRTEYAGLAFDGPVARGLHLMITGRREFTLSDRSNLDQAGFYTSGVLEYRLRLFTFGVEHRYTSMALSTEIRPEPLAFAGNQMLMRVSRRFGFVP